MALAYLVAPAGHPNYGDELITRSWLDYLREHHPDTEVWLDCHTPGVAAHLFLDAHPRLRITNTLWRLIHDAGGQPANDRRAFIRDRIHNFGTPEYDLGLLTLRRASTIHLLGGGYVNAKWEHHIGLLWGISAVTEVSNATAHATGQGLMPVIGNGTEIMEAFEAFTSVSCRDAESAAVLGITRGLDDAFLSTEVRTPRPAAEAPDMVVCIQSDQAEEPMFRTALANARAIASAVRESGGRVAYVEAIPGADHAAYRELDDVVDQFIPFTEVWTRGIPTAPGQKWVTTRFHLHLVAAAAGAAGIAVSVDPDYYSTKHRSLLDLGTGWAYVDTPDQLATPTSSPSFTNRVRGLAPRKVREADAIYSALESRPAGRSPGKNRIPRILRRSN